MDSEYAGKVKLKACRHCGRTFVPESLVKHEGNCQKVQKKRKVFDTSKQRATEDLSVKQIKQAQKKMSSAAEAARGAKKRAVAAPKSHWRQKHAEFINNIRAAKHAQGAIDAGLPLPPPPPPSENPDYVSCPHCARRFNEKAAERHINFCGEKQKRLTPKREPTAQEKARAAAKGYQAPRPKGRGAPGADPQMGGYSSTPPGGRGGYSGTPPGGRGGYSGTPPGGRGGYSSTPPGGRGGYSNASPAGRGGPSSRQDPNRAPVGGASRGRSGPGQMGGAPTRGRPSPSQPTYQPSDYTDFESQYSDLDAEDLRYGNGRALRTGRDIQSYQEARKDARGQISVPRTRATNTRAGMGANQLAATKTSNFGGRGVDSGYYSSNSEGDSTGYSKSQRKGTVPKFCHECGNRYPLEEAKFCCECGVKRMGLNGR